jgi:hypothetical protein
LNLENLKRSKELRARVVQGEVELEYLRTLKKVTGLSNTGNSFSSGELDVPISPTFTLLPMTIPSFKAIAIRDRI